MEVIATRENKVVYRDGGRAIKVFNEDFSKADILNEALNHARVEETGLNVPPILEVSKIDGKWALFYEFIEGKTLAQLMEENPDQMDEYLDILVELQLDVHDQRSPLLTKLTDKMLRKISMTSFNEIIRYELSIRLEGMPKHNKVCHGDFCASNIIIDPKGKPYIIDWSHATQGNASADVARTYLLYLLQDQKELGEKYLKIFCEKTCTQRQYIEKWIPIVAASQSVKGKAEELAMLSRFVDIKEYE